MKIKFLIGQPAKCYSSDWQEIKRLSEKEFTPDEDTYILFKALELNEGLDKELIKARKNLHLPENGLTWEEYKKRQDIRADRTKEELEEIVFYIKNYPKEAQKLSSRMYLHPGVEEQLKNLILGYFVEPIYKGLCCGCEGLNVDEIDDEGKNVLQGGDIDSVVESVNIYISKRVSKNQLIKYIETAWPDINKLLGMLPDGQHVFVSKRDLRIVELRDKQNLKYSKIAEQIIKEFSIDDMKGAINEDSIKTSYKRAKTKIEDLAKLKKGNTSSM